MQKSTEKILESDFAKHVIKFSDLMHILNKNSSACYAAVNKVLNKKELIQLKRGLYVIAPKYQNNYFSVFYFANQIAPFSYVTAESALNFHNWIPEQVKGEVISISPHGRNREFTTIFGKFIYKVPPINKSNFMLGVSIVKGSDDHPILMATPLRAIIDYIYLLKLDNVNIDYLIESLRIEPELIKKITVDEIDNLTLVYKSQRVLKFLKTLKKQASRLTGIF